ncbi:MAG: hypothetical protein KatS3mg050_4317 [Litorilinea sp.]|nr:MAG: hypothetical protein KatS3mg050_4317 [Litorilinea sp.]
MESIQTLSNQYALGHSQPELERLVHQERFLGELTEIMLLKAGLVPGMRVLDVGCGAGDVSFLAAKLVGPEGAVIGVDRAPEAIAFAHQRAQSAGLTNVQFIAADLADFQLDGEPVDAVIGRLVLMYFPDPAAVLRRLLAFVKPGGIVAFQELDIPVTPPVEVMCDPICETYVAAGTRINQALSRIGADTRIGSKLRHIYQQAGLPGAQTMAMLRYENGPDSRHLCLDRAVDPHPAAPDAADRRGHRRRGAGGHPGRAHATGGGGERLHLDDPAADRCLGTEGVNPIDVPGSEDCRGE